jgi:hypothetical protein
MARQALEFMQPGGRITVITRDTTAFKNPAADLQLASFKRAVSQAHGTMGSVIALQVDPLRPVEVPSGDFQDLIRATPQGSVIVSFMGPPLLSEAQRNQLGEIKPAIVAFCSGSLPQRVDLRPLFEQGLLKAAVISKPSPAPADPSPSSLQGWFDRYFTVVTAANAAALLSGMEPQHQPTAP